MSTDAGGNDEASMVGVGINIGGRASAFESYAKRLMGSEDFGLASDITFNFLHAYLYTMANFGCGAGLNDDDTSPELNLNVGIGAIATVAEADYNTISLVIGGYSVDINIEGFLLGYGAEAKAGYIDGKFKAKAGLIGGLWGIGFACSIGKYEPPEVTPK